MKGFCEYGRIHQQLVAVAGTAAVTKHLVVVSHRHHAHLMLGTAMPKLHSTVN
jgi:hypothetical protein